ncbi:hypothetical protein AMTR_s00078p00160030 [Amborella trichopoda]|uniref:Transmembrane protein n=1 Tax=Amborella trichopoda TaxID=13333 RepID=W1P861_AMBTC|nr:hypothetical protein AMTR_s00078p00160030 [Amborella trichopoda]
MAAWLHSVHHTLSSSNKGAIIALASLALCALTISLCTFHARRKRKLKARTHFSISNPILPFDTRHQILAKWRLRRLQNAGTHEELGRSSENCLWQKGIIMGEKCQPPDFSGVIMYDVAGKLVDPGTPRVMGL